jgi:4,5-dihydroxyphthalate decarboxylase
MHVIAMRRPVYERYPWTVMNLLKAFEEAKHRSVARVRDLTASRFPLPWGAPLADEAAKTFGENLFAYGVEANRKTLDAYCRFAHAQGITRQRFAPDDLFPKEVSAEVKV